MPERMFHGNNLPAWPATLTNADWQKKKGNIAKIAGETGIGEALDKAKHAYDQLAAAGRDFEAKSAAAFDKEWPKIKAQIEKFCAELTHAEVTAQSVANKWKSNPLIPAASLKAVRLVGSTAKDFAGDLRSLAHEREKFMKELGGG